MNMIDLLRKFYIAICKVVDAFLYGVGFIVYTIASAVVKNRQKEEDRRRMIEEQQIYQKSRQLAETEYCSYAMAVKRCLANNASYCGLEDTKDPIQLYMPVPQRVSYDRKYGWVFSYKLKMTMRSSLHGGKLKDVPASEITPAEIKNKLDEKIADYSQDCGLGRVRVLNCQQGQNVGDIVLQIASEEGVDNG